MRHNSEKFNPEFSSPEKTVGEGKVEKDKEQESLRSIISRVNGIFRVFRFIDNERKRHHLSPLFEFDYSQGYIKELAPVRYPEEQKLTEKDLHEAENKALELILEIADQILKHEPKGKNEREDPESLRQIYQGLQKAKLLAMNMQKQRPQETEALFIKILTERRGIPEENISPEQIKQLADSIDRARDFVYKKDEGLKKVF